MKHWQPDAEATALAPPNKRGKRHAPPHEVAHWVTADSYDLPRSPRRQAELSGAIAGLTLVAVGCAGVCFLLYQLLGPNDTFAG